MVPPPPPPAPPPPVDLQKPVTPMVQNRVLDRNALLSQIHQGTKLRRTATNDRSAPLIDGNKSIGIGKDKLTNSRNELLNSGIGSQGNGPAGQLGELFAQGMPKLRTTNKSFLDGGNYKSQLTSRSALTGGTSSALSKFSQNPDFKTRISVSQPATPQIQRQKPHGQTNGTVTSHDELDLVKTNPSKISPVSLKNSNDSYNNSPTKEVCTGSTSVPNITPISNLRSNLVHNSYLHQADSSKWGGSDPNLTSANTIKPRTSSKPLPPPKSDQVLCGSNVSLAKPCPPGRSRSFEEDKMEKNDDVAIIGKSGVLQTPPSLLKNPSEPSKLHMLQNHVTPLTTVSAPPQNTSHEMKSVVKPTVAPPPLPSRPPMQVSPQSKNFRPTPSGLRSSHLVHPTGAPPPPPRVLPHTNSSESKPFSLSLSASEIKSHSSASAFGAKNHPSVPPVSETKNFPASPALGMKSLSSVAPTSEASLSHLSEVKPLPAVTKQLPVRPVRKLPLQSSDSNFAETSNFESRFQSKFHDISELPKPGGFEMKRKMYPSSVVKQRASNTVDRSRLPPPVAPPPPPNHV